MSKRDRDSSVNGGKALSNEGIGQAEIPRHWLSPAGLAKTALGTGLGVGAVLAFTAQAQALNYTVSNTSDSGSGSLRDAIDQANDNPGFDRVLFQSSVSGSITLGSELDVYSSMNIIGPGADKLAIDGGNNNQLFDIYFGDGRPLVAISDLTLRNGKSGSGGAVEAGGDAIVTLNHTVLSGNEAQVGGAVFAEYSASVTLNDSVLKNNSAEYSGGAAVARTSAKLYASNSSFNGNTAGYLGGAISFGSSNVSIDSSTFSGNSQKITGEGSPYAGDGGGAIAAYTSGGEGGPETSGLTIQNSTFNANSAEGTGGAILLSNSSTGCEESGVPDPEASPACVNMQIESSTISGNTSTGPGGGIATYNHRDTEYNVTPSNQTEIDNTIVAGNKAPTGPDVFSDSGDQPIRTSFDLIGNNSAANLVETVAGSNLIGVDPKLGALADNGGPTPTMALPADSPAVNKGFSRLITDQRSQTRPVEYPGVADSAAAGANGADIGAFELQPPPPPANCVPAQMNLSTFKANAKKGNGKLKVEATAPGKFILRGYKWVNPAHKYLSAAGSLWLEIQPKDWAAKQLRKTGKTRFVARVNFQVAPGFCRVRSKARTVQLKSNSSDKPKPDNK